MFEVESKPMVTVTITGDNDHSRLEVIAQDYDETVAAEKATTAYIQATDIIDAQFSEEAS